MSENKEISQATEQKVSDKELNFRALEAKYQKELQAERQAREDAERKAQEALLRNQSNQDEDEDDEPYIDKRKLNKTLNKFGQSTQSDIQKAMEFAKEKAKEELKQEMWIDNNPDFYDVLQHAEKFAQKAPDLAKTILKMPEGFERQKLVYQNIKYMGLDKPEVKQSSVQDKIDANRRGPYYQPTGVGSSPYSASADFSDSGKKQAYEKMQQMKSKLRLS